MLPNRYSIISNEYFVGCNDLHVEASPVLAMRCICSTLVQCFLQRERYNWPWTVYFFQSSIWRHKEEGKLRSLVHGEFALVKFWAQEWMNYTYPNAWSPVSTTKRTARSISSQYLPNLGPNVAWAVHFFRSTGLILFRLLNLHNSKRVATK